MNALTWITKEAKKLRREYPRRFATWREYVAQASAIYAKKHKGKSPVGHKRRKVTGTKKKSRRSAAVKRVKKLHRAEGKAIKRLGGVQSTFMAAAIGRLSTAQHISHAKEKIKHEIGAAESRKFAAKTKRVKNKIARRIRELKSKYNKLC